MPSYATVDDYLSTLSPEARQIMQRLRALVTQAAPDAKELPDKKVPTYTLVPDTKPVTQLMLAAHPKYVSLYVFPATVTQFASRLGDCELGKGTVKWAYDHPLDEALIVEIIQYRKEEIASTL